MAGSFNSILSVCWRGTIRAFRQPAFAVAAAVLLVAAVGLNGAVTTMKLHFKKLPVPLARDLDQIPPLLGAWLQVSRDEPLDHELQDVLGTDKYIFRDYINLTNQGGRCGAELLEGLLADSPAKSVADIRDRFMAASVKGRAQLLQDVMKGKTNDERKRALSVIQFQHPDAVVNIAVTYYTGLVDTVAHVPDRCYIAAGYEPTDYDFPSWDIGAANPLQVRFIHFQEDNGVARLDRNVAYFFHVNGHYESNPVNVRLRLQNLLEKYGYYSKVELMTVDADRDRSRLTMIDFLTSAVPEVEKSFPDWDKLNHLNGK
jgi:hypothetical protein